MKISIFRIDDRLIHGQIITAWIGYSDAKAIVIADDKAATDEFQQSLLKMATPNNMTLKIFSVKDAVEFLKTEDSQEKALLLVRGPQAAYELLDAGILVDSINIGNMNMKKGKTKILGNMWVFPEDVDYLRKIDEKGVKLEVRVIPSDRSQNVMELIKKL